MLIGEQARQVREAAGARQEDVSRHARVHGLAWSRAKVAAFETGQKSISAEELALIPLVLSDACARPVTLADLIPTDARVILSDTVTATGDALLKVYAAADLDDVDIDDLGPPISATMAATLFPDDRPDVAERRYAALWQRSDAIRKRVRDFLPRGATLGQLNDLAVGVPGEAEKNAAKRLGEDPAVVLALSRLMWDGRSLAEERDRLIDDRADAGADPERLRAIRGRITRTLVSQLADEVAKYPRTAPNDQGDE